MKSIVVYFSHRGENYAVGNIAEGNAEHIAKIVAKMSHSPLLEIRPAKAYSEGYRKCTEEAMAELNAKALPAIQPIEEDMAEYDLVYLCFPCWWGTFPRPVATFLSRFDWHGKTIKPMSTHEGSGMGSSEMDLRAMCPGATIARGLAIKGTAAHSSDEAIRRWIAD